MPISRRRPPLPWRTSSDPRRGSRSRSPSASASWTRSPGRQSTTINARRRAPWRSSGARRITAMISSTVGGIELPLVAGRATGVVARQGRGRSPPTGGIERSRNGHGISSQSNSRHGPLLYRRCPSQREIALALPTPCESRRLVDQTPDARPERAFRQPQQRRLLPQAKRRFAVGPSSGRRRERRTARRVLDWSCARRSFGREGRGGPCRTSVIPLTSSGRP
jgi:hypothetical protein